LFAISLLVDPNLIISEVFFQYLRAFLSITEVNLEIAKQAPHITTCEKGMILNSQQTCMLWLSASNNSTVGTQAGELTVSYKLGASDYDVKLDVTLETELFTVGNFGLAGGKLTNFIAAWDGNEWHALDQGIMKSLQSNIADDGLAGLTLHYSSYDGNLYVGGEFGSSNGALVVWNGYSWTTPLNFYGGLTGSVYSISEDNNGNYYFTGLYDAGSSYDHNLFEFNYLSGLKSVGGGIMSLTGIFSGLFSQGKLYVGGSFTDVHNIPNTNNVAVWDGTQWNAIGNGLNGVVYQLALNNNTLYAVGNFSLDDKSSSANIAYFDGAQWQVFHNGTNGLIDTLLFEDNYLYIGGIFSEADNPQANGVAQWDGRQWNALGKGIDPNGEVKILIADSQGNLYIGGLFQTVDGLPINNIAMWDGLRWQPLGTGVNGTIYGLEIAPTLTLTIN
jgi:hypothetical protein